MSLPSLYGGLQGAVRVGFQLSHWSLLLFTLFLLLSLTHTLCAPAQNFVSSSPLPKHSSLNIYLIFLHHLQSCLNLTSMKPTLLLCLQLPPPQSSNPYLTLLTSIPIILMKSSKGQEIQCIFLMLLCFFFP